MRAPELIPLAREAPAEIPLPPDLLPPAELPPSVEAAEAFDRLAREQSMRLTRGDGGGLAGFGDGRGGTGIGLGNHLEGRYVGKSHVASAPVVIRTKPVECSRLTTIVHVLVSAEGEAAVPRLASSSGQRAFDACAVRCVLAMSFAPGLDAAGRPLAVWMDVRVTPLAGGQISGASIDTSAP